jgi:hypothetical protein
MSAARGDQQDSGLAGRTASSPWRAIRRRWRRRACRSAVRGAVAAGSDLAAVVAAIGDTGIAQHGDRRDAAHTIRGTAGCRVADRSGPVRRPGQNRGAGAEKYYEENAKRFEIPEQARVEYVCCRLTALMAQLTVSDAEVTAWYEEPQGSLPAGRGEAREPHPDPREWRYGRGKGQEQRRKDSQGSSEVAGQVCRTGQDSIRRIRARREGGRSGFFGRGNDGQAVRGCRLQAARERDCPVSCSRSSAITSSADGNKAGASSALAEVRSEIEDELKRQAASRQFAEAAEAFSNMVYEQPDSLQPAAEKFGLKVQQSGWLPRSPSPEELARGWASWATEGSRGDVLG